jgi:hypothetical protein
MANTSAVVEQLKAERERGHKQPRRIDAALAALGSSSKPHDLGSEPEEDGSSSAGKVGEGQARKPATAYLTSRRW